MTAYLVLVDIGFGNYELEDIGISVSQYQTLLFIIVNFMLICVVTSSEDKKTTCTGFTKDRKSVEVALSGSCHVFGMYLAFLDAELR